MANLTIQGVPGTDTATVAEGRAISGKVQRKARNLDGLARLVSEFIPSEIFAGQRERVYSPWVTFIAFLGQVLARGSACRESVRRVQSWCVAERVPLPDESTSAYCQARARLSPAQVQEAHEHMMQWFEARRAPTNWRGRLGAERKGSGFVVCGIGARAPGAPSPMVRIVGICWLVPTLPQQRNHGPGRKLTAWSRNPASMRLPIENHKPQNLTLHDSPRHGVASPLEKHKPQSLTPFAAPQLTRIPSRSRREEVRRSLAGGGSFTRAERIHDRLGSGADGLEGGAPGEHDLYSIM